MKSDAFKQALSGLAGILGGAACSHAATKIPTIPPEPQSIPEVGTMVLFGIGLLGVAAIIRWKIRA